MSIRRSDAIEALTARGVSGQEARDILDVLGVDALGRPQQERALIMFAKKVESDVGRQHAAAVQAAEAELEERAAQINEAFDEVDAVVRETTRALAQGSIDPSPARQRLAKAEEQRRNLAARVEQLRKDDEAAAALAEMDPVEYQTDLLNKYPALRSRLPQATVAALRDHA